MREMIKYSFLAKIRDFSLVFWPLIFPFALATAMYFSIGQMEEADFETVRAAVVTEQEGEEDVFSDYLSELEKDDSSLISIRQMSEAQAAGALADGEIEGIYYSGDTPSLTVDSSGLPQSILQMILESYLEGKQTLEDVARLHPEGGGSCCPADGGLQFGDRRGVTGRQDDEYNGAVFLCPDRYGVSVWMLYRIPVGYGTAGKLIGTCGKTVCKPGAQDAVDTLGDSSILRNPFCKYAASACIYEIHPAPGVYRHICRHAAGDMHRKSDRCYDGDVYHEYRENG